MMDWNTWYHRMLDVLVGGLMIAIVVLTLLQVGARYVFGGAFTWSEEANLFLWAWMILFAAIRTEHMRIDFIVVRLPGKVRKAVSVLIAGISVFLLGLLCWGGIQMATLTSRDYYTAMSWLSVKWVFIGLAAGTALWAVALIRTMTRELRTTPTREG